MVFSRHGAREVDPEKQLTESADHTVELVRMEWPSLYCTVYSPAYVAGVHVYLINFCKGNLSCSTAIELLEIKPVDSNVFVFENRKK